MVKKEKQFQELHNKLALKHGLDPRDVGYFRGHHFHSKHTRKQTAEALMRRLPNLKRDNSYRYESYLRRLAFIAKATDEQWSELVG